MIDRMNAKVLSEEELEDVLRTLGPIANAVKRIDYFNGDGSLDCTDDAVIHANDPNNSEFELFADENESDDQDPQVLLNVGHLRAIAELYDHLKG